MTSPRNPATKLDLPASRGVRRTFSGAVRSETIRLNRWTFSGVGAGLDGLEVGINAVLLGVGVPRETPAPLEDVMAVGLAHEADILAVV